MSFLKKKKNTTLFAKVKAGITSPDEAKEFHNLQEEKSQKILEKPDEELFCVMEVEIEPPEKAIVYPTIICCKCGEGFMEPLGRVRNRKIVCMPCFEARNE
jgi:formylmethanofuran dehydrogenase subunit E